MPQLFIDMLRSVICSDSGDDCIAVIIKKLITAVYYAKRNRVWNQESCLNKMSSLKVIQILWKFPW